MPDLDFDGYPRGRKHALIIAASGAVLAEFGDEYNAMWAYVMDCTYREERGLPLSTLILGADYHYIRRFQ